VRAGIAGAAERYALDALIRFYKIPRAILAPNKEIIQLLRERTQKPVYLMRRGVDTDLFTPARRDTGRRVFTLGYVGRLTPEKNVRLLSQVERALISMGRSDYRFLIVGDGYDRPWLERNLQKAEFTGILTGESLARAYANMDLFLFPSRTDTFGNVVLEALASGTPVIVTADGGPKYLVKHGVTGGIASDDQQFIDTVISLMAYGSLYQEMRQEAREYACSNSWDAVFDLLYCVYNSCLTKSLPAEFPAAYARSA
jgi:glycosyltransferase involved in cell wall biosynthesis